MIIKVCGMKNGENIRQVEALGIDFIGFIFYPRSPRFVDELPDYLPEHSKRVGVFVNADKGTVVTYADRFSLDYVQLHGNESPEYCNTLKRTIDTGIIKAFPVACPHDLNVTGEYEGICDYFLFDTKTSQYGGSGNRFDWSILHQYRNKTPFLLSGGINPQSARTLKEFQHPQLAGYDLNSRFELSPGIKNTELLSQLLNRLK